MTEVRNQGQSNIAEQVASLRRYQEESEKFSAEQKKLMFEAEKLSIEMRKFHFEQMNLAAEDRRLNRDSFIMPITITVGAAGAVIAAIASIINLLR